MDDQNKNLMLAMALSLLVILVWYTLFPPPEQPVNPAPETQAEQTDAQAPAGAVPPVATPPAPAGEAAPAPAGAAQQSAGEKPIEAPRIAIDTPRLSGSISLRGGRIDMLELNDYRETVDPGSPKVTLLRPSGETDAYYALFGWAPGGSLSFDDVPGPDTIWQQEGDNPLTPQSPVTLKWDNGKGLTFRRTLSVDENYMFSVEQSVTNTGGEGVRLAAYGQLVREGLPSTLKGFFVIHEGALRQTGEELDEIAYKKFDGLDPDPLWGPNADVARIEKNGWIGLTEHYWMSTLIPDAGQPFTGVILHNPTRDTYSTIARLDAEDLAPGASISHTTRLFSGAKEYQTIRNYERDLGIYRFIDAIDWGWYYFLTKPIFQLLHWLKTMIGNMGWAIIALTLILKALMFPLAYKSYVSMAKMKELQPEMEKIKERAGDDRQQLQKEMMELYKREKVNPASGCLPILLQIPVFFSLYKVVFVTIELRQAPWIGWIRDLSAPDPSSILNLFGLLPWAPPDPGSFLSLFSLGLLPILLGISMWLQQKLNPTPTDPTQATIMAWMPWVFMFMLGRFASGLVLYWITNNTITFTQQYLIMRMHGHKPDVIGNILRGFRRKRARGE